MFHRHQWKIIHQRQYKSEIYAHRPFIPENLLGESWCLTVVQECERCGKIRETTTTA